MHFPRLQFTVRGMIVAVAIVAVLIPPPLMALHFMVATSVWFGIPIGVVVLSDRLSGRLSVVVASAFLTVAWLLIWPNTWQWRNPQNFPFLLLTPPNSAGPLYLAVQLRRGRKPTSGEVLWAWIGLAWTMVLITPELRRMHSGWMNTLEILVQCTRLTLALAVLLWLYGPKPTRPGRAWGHYLGWALAECDMLAWGWIASRAL